MPVEVIVVLDITFHLKVRLQMAEVEGSCLAAASTDAEVLPVSHFEMPVERHHSRNNL